jgi:hypothetical protein
MFFCGGALTTGNVRKETAGQLRKSFLSIFLFGNVMEKGVMCQEEMTGDFPVKWVRVKTI